MYRFCKNKYSNKVKDREHNHMHIYVYYMASCQPKDIKQAKNQYILLPILVYNLNYENHQKRIYKEQIAYCLDRQNSDYKVDAKVSEGAY